jgi:hypothetical protein
MRGIRSKNEKKIQRIRVPGDVNFCKKLEVAVSPFQIKSLKSGMDDAVHALYAVRSVPNQDWHLPAMEIWSQEDSTKIGKFGYIYYFVD